MRTITLLSQKGGCGKSTLATQFAVWATQQDELACVVDLDPQASAALWRGFRKAKLPLVQKALPERLAQVADEAKALGVTSLLVDTPPHLNKAALDAIRLADLILCPTKPDLLNLGALKDTVTLIETAGAMGKTLGVINDLPTAPKAREQATETATVSLRRFGIPIAKTAIGHSQAMVDAIAEGLGITERLPRNVASKELQALWAEIVKRTDRDARKEVAQ